MEKRNSSVTFTGSLTALTAVFIIAVFVHTQRSGRPENPCGSRKVSTVLLCQPGYLKHFTASR